jgi:hypothetical protein
MIGLGGDLHRLVYPRIMLILFIISIVNMLRKNRKMLKVKLIIHRFDLQYFKSKI